MKTISEIGFFILSIVLSLQVFAENKTSVSEFATGDTTNIYLKDFGLENTKHKDCTSKLYKALENINPQQTTRIIFEPGLYHFYPEKSKKRNYFESNTTDNNPRNCTFVFEHQKNIIIEGNNCSLIFHGQMQPFSIDNCQNITIKNISIDWEKPLTAQAEVLKVTDKYIDLGIRLKEFPYRLDDGKLLFVPERKMRSAWKSTMEFDREGRFVVPHTGDRGCLGRGWNEYIAQDIIPGVLRLHHQFLRKPKTGNFLVLRHAERIHSGIFINESKNIRIENVNLYHATGLGILAQFSENLIFDRYRAIPNPDKNRYFGGGDDGLQISNCKGNISVTNCEFAGLMDDPINVHGTSVQISKIISKTQLECRFKHHQSTGLPWGHPGDLISFIENNQMYSMGVNEVTRFEPIDHESFRVNFKHPLPPLLQTGDALENLSWSPNINISDSEFKSCRARGILVSTPGKVVINNNTFESSGSAILIAGDANGWFESGAVKNVLISNNTFTGMCNSSSYQFCEAIISVFPIIPGLNKNTPPFHRNIHIENNSFFASDFPVLYAKSVDGIWFTKNKVTRSYDFEPYNRRKYTFSFEACKNIALSENTFSGDILGKNILLELTNRNALKKDNDFRVVQQ